MSTTLARPDLTIPITVMRRRGMVDPPDDRRLRAAVRAGAWIRITLGVYARGDEWRRLRPNEQHRVRVLETMHRLRSPVLISHRAAAAIWNIDTLGPWPALVETTIERAGGGRSSGRVRRYARGLDGIQAVPIGAHQITTPGQTALDLARSLPFTHGVAAVDQAIAANRPGGALTTTDEIRFLQFTQPSPRGDARAARVLDFAVTGAANVRESQMRVLVHALGFPDARVQERRVLPSGRVAYGDLYFPSHDHWLEIDGNGKYLSPEYTGGRDPAQIVIDEKARENEIRRIVHAFSRLDATDADRPRRVYDILTGDGLPSRLPRP